MNLKSLLGTLAQGVQFAEGILPGLQAIPGIGQIAGTIEIATKAAGAITETVQNVSDRIDDGKIVASSNDRAEVQGYVDRLRAVNDDLAAYVAAS